MEDSISRQAAIDALGEMPEGDDDWTSGCRYQWKLDTKLLRTLPSAQPKLPDICDGCEVRFVHGCDTECKKNVLKKYSAQPEAYDSQKEVAKYVTAFSDGYDRGKADAQPEIIRCKDCKNRIVNTNFGESGYFNLKAMCDLDTGDPFELGRNAEDDNWYCADAERRTDG